MQYLLSYCLTDYEHLSSYFACPLGKNNLTFLKKNYKKNFKTISQITKTYTCHCDGMRTILCVHQKTCKEGEIKLGLKDESGRTKGPSPYLCSRGRMGQGLVGLHEL